MVIQKEVQEPTMTEERVIYDTGDIRLIAKTDGRHIQLTKEIDGEETQNINLNERELQRIIGLMEWTKKNQESASLKKAAENRTAQEQSIYAHHLADNYMDRTMEMRVVDGTRIVVPLNGREKDESFHYHYHVFIPESEKLIVLTVRVLGNDRYGERMFVDREYYRYGDVHSYYSKRGGVTLEGKYGFALKMVLDLVKKEKEPDFEAQRIG